MRNENQIHNSKTKDGIKNFSEMRKTVLNFLGEKDIVDDSKKERQIKMADKTNVEKEKLEKTKSEKIAVSKEDIENVKKVIYKKGNSNAKGVFNAKEKAGSTVKKVLPTKINNFDKDIIKKNSRNLIEFPKRAIKFLMPPIKKIGRYYKSNFSSKMCTTNRKINYAFLILNSILSMLFVLIILLLIFLVCVMFRFF